MSLVGSIFKLQPWNFGKMSIFEKVQMILVSFFHIPTGLKLRKNAFKSSVHILRRPWLNLWNFISLISLQYPINSVLCNKLVCGRFTSRNRDVIKILSANVAKWFWHFRRNLPNLSDVILFWYGYQTIGLWIGQMI